MSNAKNLNYIHVILTTKITICRTMSQTKRLVAGSAVLPSSGRWSLTCTVVHYLEFTKGWSTDFSSRKRWPTFSTWSFPTLVKGVPLRRFSCIFGQSCAHSCTTVRKGPKRRSESLRGVQSVINSERFFLHEAKKLKNVCQAFSIFHRNPE